MITNVIAFLSSIATAVFVGICIVSINIKYKSGLKRKDLAGLFARLSNISNTYVAYPQMSERFASLQAAYYIYKQNYTLFLQEQSESVSLIQNLKKLLYIALGIWVLESMMIIFSGKNFFEYLLATVILLILVVLFIKFSAKFKDLVTDFSLGISSFPDPDVLLNPLSVPEKNQYTYVSENMPLNLMEGSTAIEFDPPRTPPPLKEFPGETDSAVAVYDFSQFEANGRLFFAFPFKFEGELRFFTKEGDTQNPFPISSEYFKAGFSHIYDIGFSYRVPLHLMEKIVLYIKDENTGHNRAKITFSVPPGDSMPEKAVKLLQPVAVKIKDGEGQIQ